MNPSQTLTYCHKMKFCVVQFGVAIFFLRIAQRLQIEKHSSSPAMNKWTASSGSRFCVLLPIDCREVSITFTWSMGILRVCIMSQNRPEPKPAHILPLILPHNLKKKTLHFINQVFSCGDQCYSCLIQQPVSYLVPLSAHMSSLP